MGGIPPCDIGEGILLTPSPNTSIQCYITRCGRVGVLKSERERRGASEQGEANAHGCVFRFCSGQLWSAAVH